MAWKQFAQTNLKPHTEDTTVAAKEKAKVDPVYSQNKLFVRQAQNRIKTSIYFSGSQPGVVLP